MYCMCTVYIMLTFSFLASGQDNRLKLSYLVCCPRLCGYAYNISEHDREYGSCTHVSSLPAKASALFNPLVAHRQCRCFMMRNPHGTIDCSCRSLHQGHRCWHGSGRPPYMALLAQHECHQTFAAGCSVWTCCQACMQHDVRAWPSKRPCPLTWHVTSKKGCPKSQCGLQGNTLSTEGLHFRC